LLARRVAMTFDRHLRESQAKGTYSKVLWSKRSLKPYPFDLDQKLIRTVLLLSP
jgi:hypothetical protein